MRSLRGLLKIAIICQIERVILIRELVTIVSMDGQVMGTH